jgi:hypothetical protein
MTKSFTIMCMFPAFNYKSNLYSKTIMKKYNYIAHDKKVKSTIYLIGSFINESDYKYIKTELKDKIKILWLSEPIIHHSKYVYPLIQDNEFNIIYGCVSNKLLNNRYKLPLYINYYKAYEQEQYYNEDFFKNINNQNKITFEQLNKKEFCTLICRHDTWNTRKPIYEQLKKIGKIICPSQFENNYDHSTFEKLGKNNFLKKFIFNVCPENSEGNYPGYITEKLMDCCLSGAIPIYYGKLDIIDQKIFNLKRILFYIPSNKESIEKIIQKIKNVMNNQNELVDFYNQDIFLENAHVQFELLIEQFRNKIDNI